MIYLKLLNLKLLYYNTLRLLRNNLIDVSRGEIPEIKDENEYRKYCYMYSFADLSSIMGTGFKLFNLFAIQAISDLIVPAITVDPIPPNELSRAGSISLTSYDSATTLCNLAYRPSMAEEIHTYILSLLCPGLIEITVDYSEYTSIVDLFIAAHFTKLAFMFNRTRIDHLPNIANNLTPESAKETELNLIRYWSSLGLCNFKPQTDKMPSECITSVAPLKIQDLISDPTGRGWMKCDITAFSEDLMTNIYLPIQRRYNCGINETNFESAKSSGYPEWSVRYALVNSLSSARLRSTSLIFNFVHMIDALPYRIIF